MSLFVKKRTVVLSLGGSLIYTNNGINVEFLKEFNKLIRKHVKRGVKFFIVCGGGKICRNYQDAAKKAVGEIPDQDIDWLGIHSTRMNAQLLRTIFVDICYPKVIYHYDEKEPPIKESVIIAAGWRPGWSTDYCATRLARDHKAREIINLSNIEVVYDKDPRKFKDAKPIERIGWHEFQKLVGDKWKPGAHLPFDPIATRLSKELGLSVFVLKGDNIKNFENLLEGKPFKGTIIMPMRLDRSFFNKEYFEMGIGYYGYTTTRLGKSFAHLASLYRAFTIKLFLNPKSVLDVGAATGLLVFYLRKLGIEAYGIEVSRYALSKVDPSIRKYLRLGNIIRLPYSNNSYELVTTFNVLEHLNSKQIPKALNECDRVKSKYCLHKIYTKENKWRDLFHPNDLSHVSIHSIGWWKDLFHKLGYRIVDKRYPKLPKFMETYFVLDKKQ